MTNTGFQFNGYCQFFLPTRIIVMSFWRRRRKKINVIKDQVQFDHKGKQQIKKKVWSFKIIHWLLFLVCNFLFLLLFYFGNNNFVLLWCIGWWSVVEQQNFLSTWSKEKTFYYYHLAKLTHKPENLLGLPLWTSKRRYLKVF